MALTEEDKKWFEDQIKTLEGKLEALSIKADKSLALARKVAEKVLD